MDLVVDANVLFASLIKDSFTYHLLFSGKFQLFTPEYMSKTTNQRLVACDDMPLSIVVFEHDQKFSSEINNWLPATSYKLVENF